MIHTPIQVNSLTRYFTDKKSMYVEYK